MASPEQSAAFRDALWVSRCVGDPQTSPLTQRRATTRSHQRLTSLLGPPLEAQLAQLLLDESVDDVVTLSRATLGARVGAQRQSVNRVLRAFGARRMVELRYGRVELLDRSALEAVACRD